jgi:hypothetical protein
MATCYFFGVPEKKPLHITDDNDDDHDDGDVDKTKTEATKQQSVLGAVSALPALTSQLTTSSASLLATPSQLSSPAKTESGNGGGRGRGRGRGGRGDRSTTGIGGGRGGDEIKKDGRGRGGRRGRGPPRGAIVAAMGFARPPSAAGPVNTSTAIPTPSSQQYGGKRPSSAAKRPSTDSAKALASVQSSATTAVALPSAPVVSISSVPAVSLTNNSKTTAKVPTTTAMPNSSNSSNDRVSSQELKTIPAKTVGSSVPSPTLPTQITAKTTLPSATTTTAASSSSVSHSNEVKDSNNGNKNEFDYHREYTKRPELLDTSDDNPAGSQFALIT